MAKNNNIALDARVHLQIRYSVKIIRKDKLTKQDKDKILNFDNVYVSKFDLYLLIIDVIEKRIKKGKNKKHYIKLMDFYEQYVSF